MLSPLVVQASNIRMYLDVARFRYDQTNTYLEIYYLLYELPSDSLPPLEKVWLEFQLYDQEKDSLLASSPLTVSIHHVPGKENEASVKGSVIKTVLPPGKYWVKMYRLNNEKGERIDSVDYKFTTTSFSSNKITVSDLELCSNIVQNSPKTKGLFYKNTMEVYPNPMHMYGEDTPEVYYYIELYNTISDNPRDLLSLEAAIMDAGGNIYKQKKYTRQRKYDSLVECGSFDISELNSGLYTLVFVATDSASDYSVFTRDNFYVMNQKGPVAESEKDMMSAFLHSAFFSMPEAEVDEKFEQTRYITTKEMQKIYKSLDSVEKKRHFLFKFWYDREQEGKGLQQEYYKRVEYANQHYRFANRAGWKSDRGRIYIVYGKPSRIERFPNGPDYRPFEIWYYHELEGGSAFYFVDESGFGDYKLVTSTYRDELFDPGWDQQIQDWLRRNPNYNTDIR